MQIAYMFVASEGVVVIKGVKAIGSNRQGDP